MENDLCGACWARSMYLTKLITNVIVNGLQAVQKKLVTIFKWNYTDFAQYFQNKPGWHEISFVVIHQKYHRGPICSKQRAKRRNCVPCYQARMFSFCIKGGFWLILQVSYNSSNAKLRRGIIGWTWFEIMAFLLLCVSHTRVTCIWLEHLSSVILDVFYRSHSYKNAHIPEQSSHYMSNNIAVNAY